MALVDHHRFRMFVTSSQHLLPASFLVCSSVHVVNEALTSMRWTQAANFLPTVYTHREEATEREREREEGTERDGDGCADLARIGAGYCYVYYL